MKKIILLISFALFSVMSIAQNNVGIGTTTPDANAILDLRATDQGILIPRIDTNTILNVMSLTMDAGDDGMLVYADEINAFVYWDGDSLDWFILNENVNSNTSDDDWGIIGNTVFNSNDYIVVGGTNTDVLAEIRMLVKNKGTRTALAGASNGDGSVAVGVEGFATGSNNSNIGVLGIGESVTVSDTVIGVVGKASKVGNVGVGVRGVSELIGGTKGIGGSFSAIDSAGGANIVGVEGIAISTGLPANDAKGVYGSATGATTNWAGYFQDGNVYIDNKLGIGTFPTTELDISGKTKTDSLMVTTGAGTLGNVLTDDGTGNAVWMAAGGADGNGIYDGSGTTPSNTAVTVTDNINFDANTMYIDGTNSRIGIGTTTPAAKLEVKGDIHLTNDGSNHFIGLPAATGGNNGNLTIQAAGQAAFNATAFQGGNLILSAGNLNTAGGSWAGTGNVEIVAGKNMFSNTNHGDILFKGGNTQSELARFEGETGYLGLGTASPNAELQFGNTIKNRKIVLYEETNNDHQYYGFGINGNILRYQAPSATANHVFYAGTGVAASNELMRIDGTGNVGIGTAAPTDKLHLVGTSGNTFRMEDGNQAANKVLTSDANGNATWEVATGSDGNGIYDGSGTTPSNTAVTVTDNINFDANTMYIDGTNSRIGIGTAAPLYPLDVTGDIRSTGVLRSTLSSGLFLKGGDDVEFWDVNVANLLQIRGLVDPTTATLELGNTGGGITGQLGNYGIGTISPTDKLHLVGTSGNTFRMEDGNQAANKVLTSDANGNATWEVASGDGNGIYDGSGSLTEATVVTGGANTLDFTTTAVDGFSVDGTTFSVDGVNNRIGIGTATPSEKLEVVTATNNYGLLQTDGTVEVGTWVGGAGGFLGTKSNHNVTIFTNNNSGAGRLTITPGGGVGVGTNVPNAGFHIKQLGTGVANGIRWTPSVVTGNEYFQYMDASDNLNINNGAIHYLTLQNTTGNIGIGNGAPTEKLDVAGRTRTTELEVTNGAGTSGNILTDDGSGNAVWMAPGGAGWSLTGNNISLGQKLGTLNAFDLDIQAGGVTAINVNNATRNVGIGMASASEKLQVDGSIALGTNTAITENAVTVYLTNRTGAASQKGDIVIVDPANDNSFIFAPGAGHTSVIGVIYETGVANGQPCKIAISGIADVRSNVGSIRGQHCVTAGVSGSAATIATPGVGTSVGVWLEQVGAGALGKVLLK